jgi:hypothetical protein
LVHATLVENLNTTTQTRLLLLLSPQGLVTGVTPQVLQHGAPFWEVLVGDPVKGAVFDRAMHSEKHCMAGVTVVTSCLGE